MLTVRSRKYKRVGKQTCSKDKILHKNRTCKSRKSCNKTLKGGSGRGAGGRTAMSKTLDAKILEFLEIYSNLDKYDYVDSTTEKKRTMLSTKTEAKSDPLLRIFKNSVPVQRIYNMIQTRKLQTRLSDLKDKSMAMPVDDEIELGILLAKVKPDLDKLVAKHPYLKSITAANKHSKFPSVPSEEPGEGLNFPSPPKSGNKPGIIMDPEYVKYVEFLKKVIYTMQTEYRPAIFLILTPKDSDLIRTINGPAPINSKQKLLIPAINNLIKRLLENMEKPESLKLKK